MHVEHAHCLTFDDGQAAGSQHRDRLSRIAARHGCAAHRYLGVSRGASFAGTINLALEPRIRAAALASGGIRIHSPLHPMIDLISYAPRITVPVLMLSGRYDHIYPYEQSQKRVFELLGTPAGSKTRIEYDTGAFHAAANGVAADVTDWFDRYLGRVRN